MIVVLALTCSSDVRFHVCLGRGDSSSGIQWNPPSGVINMKTRVFPCVVSGRNRQKFSFVVGGTRIPSNRAVARYLAIRPRNNRLHLRTPLDRLQNQRLRSIRHRLPKARSFDSCDGDDSFKWSRRASCVQIFPGRVQFG